MTDKRILGTGNFALDSIYQRGYPQGFDTARKRNPFVDKLVSEEVGNTCGNVMCMLPYLGGETYPIGHFDDTEQGMKIKADLERYGANTRFVKNSKEGGTTLMTCVHKLDANGQHVMSHRATSPNSRFPKRKQLRKDEVAGFVEQLDFRPDAYFFDVSDAGPRELAAALKDIGGKATSLVIDLADLEYISSAGLRQIVSAYKLMKGRLTLSNVSAEVMHVFKMAGFDKRLNII
jgi:hypothetical protein